MTYDAKVEQKHRDLDHRQCCQVEVLIEIVDLENVCDVPERYSPDVFAESEIGHCNALVSTFGRPMDTITLLTDDGEDSQRDDLQYSNRHDSIVPAQSTAETWQARYHAQGICRHSQYATSDSNVGDDMRLVSHWNVAKGAGRVL